MLELNFSPFPEMITERLKLREVVASDAPEILQMRSNPEVMRYVDRDPMQTIAEAEKLIAVYADNAAKQDAINWGITLKGSNKIIGVICLWQIQKENYRAETGYMLQYEYFRKGIMNEALTAVIAYGFETMKLHSIEAIVNPGNDASIGLLEKKGFIREGLFRENYFYNGKFLDSGVYSLLNPQPHLMTT